MPSDTPGVGTPPAEDSGAPEQASSAEPPQPGRRLRLGVSLGLAALIALVMGCLAGDIGLTWDEVQDHLDAQRAALLKTRPDEA